MLPARSRWQVHSTGPSGSDLGTFPDSINEAGVVTGHFIDAQGFNHGFLRKP
ncbi:MAG TPA: hypothetical protein VGR80_14660 [Steroidobacteraceae bacterium]|nr:hypothetical protein [Steroidobacteraceae bacterium]